MALTDWLTLTSVLVAAAAAAVALRAYRLQRTAQDTTVAMQLATVTDRIQTLLAQTEPQRRAAMTGGPPAPETPDAGFTRDALYDLALHAERLAGITNLEMDWNQHITLAHTLSDAWDNDAADPHWRRALQKAGTPQAKVRCLLVRSTYLANRNDPGDLESARAAIRAALDHITGGRPGPYGDTVRDQGVLVHHHSAQLELMTGHPDHAARALARALDEAPGTEWRRRRADFAVARLISHQPFVPPAGLVTAVKRRLRPETAQETGTRLDEAMAALVPR
jgi:hypothetical protein